MPWYDTMETYAGTCFPGFAVFEVWIEGEPYYKCVYPAKEGEICFLVDEEEKHARLSYQEREVEFVYGYGFGTGSWEDRYLIYDAETMELYEVQTDFTEQLEQIEVQAVAVIENQIIARVLLGQEIYYSRIYLWSSEEKRELSEYVPIMGNRSHLLQIPYRRAVKGKCAEGKQKRL